MASGAIPTWGHTGQGEEVAWDMLGLGGDYLPGQWRVEGLEVGIDCDTKKAKGADGPTSADNGVKAADFRLVGKLKADQWEDFLFVLPNFNPRRPGRERHPVPIVYPSCAALGITNVRVLNVGLGPPTAKSGMEVKIEVVEWFEKPRATKKSNQPTGNVPAPAIQLVGADGVLEHMDRRHGAKRDKDGNLLSFEDDKFPNPADHKNAFGNAFNPSGGITSFGSGPEP